MNTSSNNPYKKSQDGIFRPTWQISHREEEYDPAGFATLYEMQEKHFWYRGRHRFLMHAVNRYLPNGANEADVIDLGGGVGGWVRCLEKARPGGFSELALADSSEVALEMAAKFLSPKITKYQIDLMNLGWEDRWDAAFLLDVIEHLPDDTDAVSASAKALKPGGFLFITTPASQKFWSYHDDLAQHKRRYVGRDFQALAEHTGLKLIDARYFMFFLSPLYLLSRAASRTQNLSEKEKRTILANQSKTPAALVNSILSLMFCAETPIGHLIKFPWGTSILGVFQKRRNSNRINHKRPMP
jgi:SAM-dependent methyltransferase